MGKDRRERQPFSLLTAVSIIFALVLCLLASAMVYIAVPSSAPYLRLLFGGADGATHFTGALSLKAEATPFQPAYPMAPEETEPPAPTPTPLPVPQATPAQSTEAALANLPEPDFGNLPPAHYIDGVYGRPQEYNLDCEAQSAVDFAKFFDININKQGFIDAMPRSDDPEEGFVGDINGAMGQLPPAGYGVHAKPIAKLLRQFGVPAKAVRGWTLDQIRAEIAAGRPVIVWIVNLPFDIEVQEYTPSNGNTVAVARFEHTWIVTGYNMSAFTVVDSEWTYNVKIATLQERWEALGAQAIVYRGE